jgi:hypothetical protein
VLMPDYDTREEAVLEAFKDLLLSIAITTRTYELYPAPPGRVLLHSHRGFPTGGKSKMRTRSHATAIERNSAHQEA